ncbi:MAG: NADH-quinone oxidoreductase subunit NuoG [Thermodesulfovibrionales bacterium]
MATIFIDNKPYTVKDGDNLLHACLSLGFDLPYFCWHPAMHSVGACRQCAVKQFRDENDTRGKIVMACMTPAADGTRISIDDPDAKAFRADVIEWLMLSHPHDCPVCDEGGECHLQDMTVMTGHAYRRTRFKKRTHRNQYLGPFINHEMNRCIQCYRCVRFYRDYAGGRDFNVFACNHAVYFGRHEEGVLENEFSGNLVEVCPTGVFTDKTLKQHYVRKWDLQTAPSVCVHCGIGCNIIPGERRGDLLRVHNRFHSEINGYFLCDRGRYGYDFVNCNERIRMPRLRRTTSGGKPVSVTKEEALGHIAGLLHFGARVIGIGSPRASLEANFALRSLVGAKNFCAGMSEKDLLLVRLMADILIKGPARSPSLSDIAGSDAVFVLGEDLTNSAPMIALALRQSVRQKPMAIAEKIHIPKWNDSAVREAVQNEKGPLFLATPCLTKLEEVAAGIYHGAPEDIARLGFAVAHELDPEAPVVEGMTEQLLSLARVIAGGLGMSERPLVVSGQGCGSAAVIEAAANISLALYKKGKPAGLCFAVEECNTLGIGMMGGGSLEQAITDAHEGKADTVIILENDIFRRTEKAFAEKLFTAAGQVIVIDHLKNETTDRAETVLPASTFAETGGTLVNSEGRAQRFFQVFLPGDEVMEGWRWLLRMLDVAGRPEAGGWSGLDDITSALCDAYPVFAGAKDAAPQADFRMKGRKIPRQPHRYSGRTALLADISVHEPKPPDDHDSPLSFSMEGYEGIPPSALIPRYWAGGWNSVQALNKFQEEVGGLLRGGDPGRRLIEPDKKYQQKYFDKVPGPFFRREGEWLLIPLYHIFGSEELSSRAQAIAERSPAPYIALNSGDASGLGVADGGMIGLSIFDASHHLTVRTTPSLPEGVAGVPVGIIPHLNGSVLPAWGRLKKGEGG